jgi:hypothetical protein
MKRVPANPDGCRTNILLVGGPGSGKSSIVDTLDSIFLDRISYLLRTTSMGETESLLMSKIPIGGEERKHLAIMLTCCAVLPSRTLLRLGPVRHREN